ncbi:ESPR-type extended signal peptide-containing protein, partial [Enterobacter cloacae]|uniref:ESPR-type extended signal peptide-containing protein n=2 Tax=Enterobacterales TaxID=91347 RepID=UPI003966F675
MNKIYKLVWNMASGEWVVCSEFGRKTKSSTRASILFGAGLCLTPGIGFAATCAGETVPDNNFTCASISETNTPNGDYELLNKTSVYFTTSADGYGKNFVLENKEIDVTNVKYRQVGVLLATRGYDSTDIRYSTLTGNNLKVIADGVNAENYSITGLGAAFGSSVYFNNVNLEFKNANNGDINGLMAGQGYGDSGNLSSNSKTNYVEINNDYTFKATKSDLINKNPVTGIRAIQNNDGTGNSKTGVGPTAHVAIKGSYNADITAAYGNGVYVSGKDSASRTMPVVELQGDTSITLHGGGNALHIGKKNRSLGSFYVIRDGWGAGQINFGENSIVNINQSDALGEAIVLTYGGSKLEAGKAKEFNVRSKDSAIRVGNDFLTNSIQNSTTEISANINNANFAISDDSLTASLLRIVDNQADVKFNFTGDKTQLIAAKSGALLQVGNASNIDMVVSEGKVQGLTEMGTQSSIDLTLNEGAVWQLAKNGTDTQSTFTTLNLNNSSLIAHDVNQGNSTGNNNVSDFTLKGNVLAKNSEIDMANGVAGDKLTIDGDFTTGRNVWLMDSYLTGEGVSSNNGGDGKSYTDTVIITGNTIDRGFDYVWIDNLNVDKPTGQESLELIKVNGQSDGEFLLQRRVVKGNYEYLLNKHSDDGSWYLESFAMKGETGATGET